MESKGIPYIHVFQLKLFKVAAILLLLAGVFVYFYSLSIKKLIIFPNNEYLFTFYNDHANGGNSQIISSEVSDSLLKIKFENSNAIPNPYVGIGISRKDHKSINLSNFNQLEIISKGINVNGLGIAIYTSKSKTEKNFDFSEILTYSTFHIDADKNSYRVNLDRFKIPDWWMEYHNVNIGDNVMPNFANVNNINISNAYVSELESIKTIEIFSLAFSRDNKTLAYQILLFQFIMLSIIFLSLVLADKYRKNKKTVTIAYKPVESEIKKLSKSDFIEYINNNYHNSQLTLEMVAGETGINQRKIASSIQEQFKCNFKTYINHLRINESKRLLLETNLNIGEIAYKIGFNNQSHFNRVFKSELQISPTEFREKKSN